MTTTTPNVSSTPAKRRGMSAAAKRDLRDGLIFTSPFITGVLLLWAGPMLYSLFLITQEWNMLKAPEFIGLGNFERMLNDQLVSKSLWNTAYYTFFSVPLQLFIAFVLALMLNQPIRGIGFYRATFYVPAITPAVAFAIVWVQILNPEFGVLNEVLSWVGIGPIKWLFDPIYAKPGLIIMSLWLVGPQMIIFLAGLQGVPKELIEAAEIDGANTWQRFKNVTWPFVSPITFFNTVIGIIGSFQVFTSVYIMTRGSGSPQQSTLFYVLYLYQNGFDFFKMGYAASLAWVLFLIILVFTAIQFYFANRWVYYEGST